MQAREVSASGTVDLQVEAGIAQIVLNRPSKHNALTLSMYDDIARICGQVNRDDRIRAVVIRGAGEKAFCAGSDTGNFADFADFMAWTATDDYTHHLLSIQKPCIAAIKGWALGGGLEIALACDIRVASQTAVFGAPEVTLGWTGAGGAAQHLTRLVGYGQTMRILLTGDRVDAEEAKSLGIIECLVEAGREVDVALEYAERITGFDAFATQSIKSAVRHAMSHSVAEGLRIEKQLMTLCFTQREFERLFANAQNPAA
ncbi:enoyl-CoA hydratase/isomerase family protein [Caulobacter sp. X]|uniref:enoyl-CoA hydratase/isomerase family protein n=1 Tax=Caulobacter sp. X TaxID=2048901 RepID=UPI0013747A50|nr:enoyl-CoA hydratase/isomerase family protein [Caulobacter sp. X]